MIIKLLLSPIKILGWALVGDYKFVDAWTGSKNAQKKSRN